MGLTSKAPQDQHSSCTQDIIRNHCAQCSQRRRKLPRRLLRAIVGVPQALRSIHANSPVRLVR
jgi:hypothetical protein